MARLALFAAGLALLAAGAAAAGDPTSSLPGVHDLDPDSFDKIVNGGKAALVEFYAPWCGHCKSLVPHYKKLGELVESDPELKGRVVVAKVDADKHSDLGGRFDVEGFPTIKFFARGKSPKSHKGRDFQGSRTADGMVKFLKKKLAEDKGFARVKALDEVVAKAKEASKEELKKVVDALEAAAKALEGEGDKAHGALYVKLAKKAADKGAEWLGKERERLDRMIGSGSVAADKVAEMSAKSSILGGFLGEELPEPAAGGDDEDEEPEEADEEPEEDDDMEDDDEEEGADEEPEAEE